jgi:hypothetical protein
MVPGQCHDFCKILAYAGRNPVLPAAAVASQATRVRPGRNAVHELFPYLHQSV